VATPTPPPSLAWVGAAEALLLATLGRRRLAAAVAEKGAVGRVGGGG